MSLQVKLKIFGIDLVRERITQFQKEIKSLNGVIKDSHSHLTSLIQLTAGIQDKSERDNYVKEVNREINEFNKWLKENQIVIDLKSLPREISAKGGKK